MILSRLSKAVREQNWFAVVLEFVIVIAGVVIGFQVTAWNAARVDQARETAYIERLRDDFVDIENTTRGGIESYTEMFEAADRIMAFIESGEAEPADDATFRSDLSSILLGTIPPPRSTTFREMESAGQLSLISDPELRETLIEIDALLARYDRVFDFVFTQQDRYGEYLNRYLVYQDTLGESGVPDIPSVSRYDLAAMRADPQFLPAMSTLRRGHGFNVFWLHSVHEQVSSLRADLDERVAE
jgi:hypothetical protein